MKTTTDYCKLAWKELRAQFKQVFVIMLAVVTLGMIAACVLYGAYYWFTTTQSIIAALVTIMVALLVVLTVGLFNYYIPVWFLTLVRKQQPWYEAQTGYLRALIAAFLVLLPSMLQEIVSLPMDLAQEPSIIASILVLLLMPPVIVFSMWWTYAVGHILSFRVYDHPDRTVLQSVGDSIRMMKGYKLSLLCIDLLIMLLPVIVLVAVIFVLVFGVAFVMALAPEYTVLAAVIAAVVALPVVAVYGFVVEPMLYIAHALFYEDMRAEQEATMTETSVE
jgi:hypothetical protein